ncbi:MAG: hypothetical protein KGI02_08870, partial [Thaumarchaeota archaeon]|nr:hypothetical protein [Nitrososphaerota archaeon]MDE1878650.1 hypothetical protein [Nitrososphaerota archaeon]
GTKHYGKIGIKKCRTCNKFFRVTDDEWKCPCCQFRLSTKPKQPKWKKRYEDPSYNGPLAIRRY